MLPLTPETIGKLEILFPVNIANLPKTLLGKQCGDKLPRYVKRDAAEVERIRIAAVKYSDGSPSKLQEAVDLANLDYRDLLMATGLANDVEAHKKWEPKLAGDPSEIVP